MPCGTSRAVSTRPAMMSLDNQARRYVRTAVTPGMKRSIACRLVAAVSISTKFSAGQALSAQVLSEALSGADRTHMSRARYRLVTRSDFDGLVCALLLKELEMVDDILFVHPKDVQDGKVDITDRDITTNLPYDGRAYMVFDHHYSETLRNPGASARHITDPAAPSAARVVYDYFGGAAQFPSIGADLMRAVDQADSAQYSVEEILHPRDWVLLNFLMDARTGLGRF